MELKLNWLVNVSGDKASFEVDVGTNMGRNASFGFWIMMENPW